MLTKLSRGRRFKNHIFTVFCYVTSIVSVIGLALILWTLIEKGLGHFNLALFVDTTPAAGFDGGLRDAIIGSVIITGLGILFAIPVGILIATFLSEYGRKSGLAKQIRFVNDVLLSAPSILMGLFIYTLVVKTTGSFSGLAGALSLMIIAVPMITRTTEDVLYLVSPMLKEAAVALGIPRWRVTVQIVYRAARSGIVTAVLLALARIAGETAPLLFTSLNNEFSNTNPLHPMASLPVVIYRFAMSPYHNWQALAWSGALLITLVILGLNLFARLFTRVKTK
jgi:phosphate transport system permease protein